MKVPYLSLTCHLGYSPSLSSGTSIKYLVSLIVLCTHKHKKSYQISQVCQIPLYHLGLHLSACIRKAKNNSGLNKLEIYFSLIKEIWKQAVQDWMTVSQNCRRLRLLSIYVSPSFQAHGYLMVQDGCLELQPLDLHSRQPRGKREKSVNSLLLTFHCSKFRHIATPNFKGSRGLYFFFLTVVRFLFSKCKHF